MYPLVADTIWPARLVVVGPVRPSIVHPGAIRPIGALSGPSQRSLTNCRSSVNLTVRQSLGIARARPSDHHFLGRRQRHIGIVALDAVDVPLQAGEVDDVAVVVVGDVLLVLGGEGLDRVPWARAPSGRR